MRERDPIDHATNVVLWTLALASLVLIFIIVVMLKSPRKDQGRISYGAEYRIGCWIDGTRNNILVCLT